MWISYQFRLKFSTQALDCIHRDINKQPSRRAHIGNVCLQTLISIRVGFWRLFLSFKHKNLQSSVTSCSCKLCYASFYVAPLWEYWIITSFITVPGDNFHHSAHWEQRFLIKPCRLHIQVCILKEHCIFLALNSLSHPKFSTVLALTHIISNLRQGQ